LIDYFFFGFNNSLIEAFNVLIATLLKLYQGITISAFAFCGKTNKLNIGRTIVLHCLIISTVFLPRSFVSLKNLLMNLSSDGVSTNILIFAFLLISLSYKVKIPSKMITS